MENTKIINFLEKPKINAKSLNYIQNSKDVYANLYEIKITKELKLFQNPFHVTPQINEADFRIRDKLFKAAGKKLKAIYGDCFISGDSLYSMKPILVSSEIDDSRPTVIRKYSENPTFVSVLSGKINTVYDLDEVLDDE